MQSPIHLSELRQLSQCLLALDAEQARELLARAVSASTHDPKAEPIRHDCLMASLGRGAAQYRHVTDAGEGQVTYAYSSSPLGRGRRAVCTLAKWQAWATRASIIHCSSQELHVPGAGWQLHSDIIGACALVGLAAIA